MDCLHRAQRRIAVFCLSLALAFISIGAGANSATQRPRQSPRANGDERPRLVLLIVVDQFRYDYLERFGDLFAANGLKRLMREGASWVDCNYDHFPTYTAPGHATLMTGAFPAETGIVANEWPDRETGKKVSSVSDDSVNPLGGGKTEGASPRRLMSSTVGDELRLATNEHSKVVGISLKDRSAILPAGRHANAAFWFSVESGNMESSGYYFPELPAWVAKFNQSRPADKYFGARWDRLLPDESEYVKRMGPDAPPWENIGKVPGDTNAFPHFITGGASGPGRDFYSAFDYSPFSSDMLVSFSEQAIDNEKLGQDDYTDVLSVSFSADDYIGHRYGPYSQEVMDVTLRVDRQIGALLEYVDAHVGLNKTVVIFSADHGMAPIPEHAEALGLGGARVKASVVLAAMRAAISARYNPEHKAPDPTADYIFKYDDSGTMRDGFISGNLYFNGAALKRDGISSEEIERVAGAAALSVPGMSRYFTRSQLLSGAVSFTDPIERRVIHGFYPRRSGDVIVIQEPFKYLVEYSATATHGSPYSYDTHVPLIIRGAAVEPGRYYQSASPADLAATLSAILKIQPPSNSTGRILVEALIKPGSRPTQRK